MQKGIGLQASDQKRDQKKRPKKETISCCNYVTFSPSEQVLIFQNSNKNYYYQDFRIIYTIYTRHHEIATAIVAIQKMQKGGLPRSPL